MTQLFGEFGLTEARWETPEFAIALRRGEGSLITPTQLHPALVASAPAGTPVASPMMGVYYGSSSPSAEPFVREGEAVVAGQVVALIEAMKVYNEITAPVSGKVTSLLAKSGDLVNPGDPLMYIS
ncbi:MAG: hypothetical protein C4320_02385 [Armatimonadota bacterium]